MKTFFAAALLATTGFTAKHPLMSYDKYNYDHYTEICDELDEMVYYCYYEGYYWYTISDLYVSATQPVEWTDDSRGINFEQLGLFEAAS